MNKDIVEEIRELSRIADKNGLIYTLPSDDILVSYQNKIGFFFNEETKIYFKNLPYLSYNGLEPLLLTGDSDNWLDLLSAVYDAREAGLPTDWLPIMEANGDYYAVRPDGKVVFWSHDGSSDEEWENIATWIHEVWIGGN